MGHNDNDSTGKIGWTEEYAEVHRFETCAISVVGMLAPVTSQSQKLHGALYILRHKVEDDRVVWYLAFDTYVQYLLPLFTNTGESVQSVGDSQLLNTTGIAHSYYLQHFVLQKG